MFRARAALGRLTVLLLLCLGTPLVEAGLLVDQSYLSLTEGFEYLVDADGELTLPELLVYTDRYPMRSAREGLPDVHFQPIWLKLELEFSEEMRDRRFYLSSLNENLYDIRLYLPDQEGNYYEWVTGNDFPAQTRDVDSPRYSFQIDPIAGPMPIYLRIVGGPGVNRLAWVLVEDQTFVQQSWNYFRINLSSLSAIATLLMFNLCIAVSLRRADYLWYSLYISSVLMGLITFEGMGFYHFWPEYPAVNDRALLSFNLLAAATRLMVIISFLNLARHMPALHTFAKAVAGGLCLCMLVVLMVGVRALPPLLPSAIWLLGTLVGLYMCLVAIRGGLNLAVPLTFALMVPTVSAIVQGLLMLNSSHVSVWELQLAQLGYVVHVLVFSLCLAAQLKVEIESRIQALHDSLTGLPGPILLRERFEHAYEVSQRQGWKLGVLFIDLDGFKAVNDERGHHVGDALLVQVAQRLEDSLRDSDTAARLGGDEFVVLLSEVKQYSAISGVANKLVAAVAEPYVIAGEQIRISASIGVAVCPDEGKSLPELLQSADSAMYRVKGEGKNAYAFSESAYSPAV